MRTGIAAFALFISGGAIAVSQTPSTPPTPGPRFEVVSIKRNQTPLTPGVNPIFIQRADGGFTQTRVPISSLIGRAYSTAPIDMVGLPEWALREYYDVSATSSLTKATAEDRTAMMRAMLADRVQLLVHVETREQPVYDLLVARGDGKLGAGLTPIDADCAAKLAADRAAAEAAPNAGVPPPRPEMPDFNAPPPACTLRTVALALKDRQLKPGTGGDLMEGEATMETLAMGLRMSTGRLIVDKTGLRGSYRINMLYDMMGSRRGPEITPAPDAVPTVFTAIRERLGLKLESSKALLDTLIIDRLERPSEN